LKKLSVLFQTYPAHMHARNVACDDSIEVGSSQKAILQTKNLRIIIATCHERNASRKSIEKERGMKSVKRAICFGVGLLLLFGACQRPQRFKHTFYRMDTVQEITIVVPRVDGGTEARCSATWERIDSLLKDWEERFAQTSLNSELLLVNNRTSDTIAVSPILAEMVDYSIRKGDSLDGMFDITILPIKELWGFGEKERRTEIPIPADSLVRATLASVSLRHIQVDTVRHTLVFSDSTVRIDLGGVAKAFAFRDLVKLLQELGYADYLICSGGDILVKGRREDGKPWKIAIKHPRNQDAFLATVELDSGAVVTSGDYEHFFIRDGKRYHHIFNPKTGYCCTRNQSVTFWGMNMADIDLTSTGLFCLPAEEILGYVESHPSMECVVVDSLGGVHVSGGWKHKVAVIE
jgi:thiamine biosynthesis lipoprotein